MNADTLRERFQQFFEERSHQRIRSAPLLPENDPTVLFTTAGMHPLVPYLLGEPHRLGSARQRAEMPPTGRHRRGRRQPSHLTFFEMLGNWLASPGGRLAPMFRNGNTGPPAEILARDRGRIRRHLGNRPRGQQLPAQLPRTRPQVQQVIRRPNHVRIMLHHQDRIPQVAQVFHDA